MIKDFCSIGSTWNQKGWLRWAIPGLLGLLFLTLFTRCSPVEKDLGERTQSLLNDKGMGWAKTSLDGRDMLLTGEAPNAKARDGAVALAEGVYGVRVVDQDISLKEWFSSTFNLKQDGDKIVLSGSMPDQDSIDAAVSKAHALYGDVNVTNKLSISDSASAPAWLAGTTGLMGALFVARDLAINASDDKVEITGEVETEVEKARLIAEAKANFGDNFSESIRVVKTRPTDAELAAIAEAKLVEEKRLAEVARLAAEAEAARLAETQRLAAEAEAAKLAEAARLAAEAEAARLAEAARAKAEADRLAAITAEKQRLAAIEAAKVKAAQAQMAQLASCQSDFTALLNDNPTLFNKNGSLIGGESYKVMGTLAQKINYCSPVLHAKNRYIDVNAHASEGETTPISAAIRQQRVHSAISYLEIISGAHRGLLRPGSAQAAEHASGNSQLHFTILE